MSSSSAGASSTIEDRSSVNAEEEADNNFDKLARFLRDDSWRKNMCSMLSNNDDDNEDGLVDGGSNGGSGDMMTPLQFVLSIGSNLKTVREVYESNPRDLNVSTFYVACENIASPGVLSFLLEQRPDLIQEAHEQDLSLVDAILFGYPEPEVDEDGEPATTGTDPHETRRREDNIRVLVEAWPSILLTTYRAYAETTIERCLVNKRCTNGLKQFLVSMFPRPQQDGTAATTATATIPREFILHNGPDMDLRWLSQILPKIQSFKSYSDQWDEDQPPQQLPPEEQREGSTATTTTTTTFQDLLKLVLLENQHLERVHIRLPSATSMSRRSSSSSSSSSCFVGSSGGEESTTHHCQEEEEEAGRSRKRRRVSLDHHVNNNNSHHHHHHHHHHHRRRRRPESILLSLLKDSLSSTTGGGTSSSKMSKLVLVGVPQRDVPAYQETILKILQEKNTTLQSLELYCGQWSNPQNQYGDCYFPLTAAPTLPEEEAEEDDDDADYDSDLELDPHHHHHHHHHQQQQQQPAMITGGSTSITTPSVGRRLQHFLMLNQFGRAKVKNTKTTVTDFLDLLGKVRDYQSSSSPTTTKATTTNNSAVVVGACSSSAAAAAATATGIMSVEYDLLQEMLGSHPGLLPSLLASINTTTTNTTTT